MRKRQRVIRGPDQVSKYVCPDAQRAATQAPPCAIVLALILQSMQAGSCMFRIFKVLYLLASDA